ncbi:MAG: hypothetical protein EX254_06645 [Flavobacteriaceae bacterium]|nr:glutaredoxin family protein [Bacteroidia bacterium]NNK26810.1 hypothetical protein [Flavobacteriaceae bacterium]NNL62006.1 hypothetical protein [Flavobacteriaceae bacterium]RZV63240.1 MAG: hypothetical protein EX254_06645 [Flavobacteriaceae bacterium]
MKALLSVLTFLLLFSNAIAQGNEHPYVSLKEKIKGKRYELFAVNTNDISYDVFLMVDTQDFRRSSSRPVIKTIPANSEIRLITMIKLNDKEGNYNTTFVVNEIAQELSMRKDNENFEIKFDNALRDQEVTLYTKDACNLCDETKQLLERNRINYSEISIEKDSVNLLKLVKEFKKIDLNQKAIVPILKIDDSLYTRIKNKADLIKALKNHF